MNISTVSGFVRAQALTKADHKVFEYRYSEVVFCVLVSFSVKAPIPYQRKRVPKFEFNIIAFICIQFSLSHN